MSTAEGFVVPAGGGKHFNSPTPGRSFAMKLLGRETNESIMMFEETLPAGTASTPPSAPRQRRGRLGARRRIHLHDRRRRSRSAAPAPARSCRATSRMPGRTPAAKPAASCFSTPRPPPAASLRSSRSAIRPTTNPRQNSLSATAGRSSARTRFEAGNFSMLCRRAAQPFPTAPCS